MFGQPNIKSIILNVDSYKASHFKQYHPNIKKIYSYVEARKSEFPYLIMAGTRYLRLLLSQTIDLEQIYEAQYFFKRHGVPFNTEGWEEIARLGRLPIEIRALPEGAAFKPGIPCLSVVNTDPRFPWLPSYLETLILRAIWYPTSVATISHFAKKRIARAMKETSDSLDGLNFKLHDFGARGVSSSESAAIGGMAHLFNFEGSDTVEAVRLTNALYDCEMSGFSIPAAEHSTVTSWGGRDGEEEMFRNMVAKFGKPGALFAVVSDSYDIRHAVDHIWGKVLRQEVIDSEATLVVRPDSGDPVEIVMYCLESLGNSFGTTTNAKGFKVLNNVRVIQGDGVNLESIGEILDAMKAGQWSADNIAFGMGGALLQKVNRDTFSFAMKASAKLTENSIGETTWEGFRKDPVTDTGKGSKEGLVYAADGRGVEQVLECADLRDVPSKPSAFVEVYPKLWQEDLGTIRTRIDKNLFKE